MKSKLLAVLFILLFACPLAPAAADDFAETIEVFKNAGASAAYFENSYGYAVFPSIGRAGFGIGGAHGNGRVYVNGRHVGDTRMSQVTIGLQLGGQTYRQIIFFEDERAFREFSSGNYEFGGQASAVAIKAGASAAASTAGGGQAGATDGDSKTTSGGYYKGMAVFTVARGGLMYEASIGGQKFSYSAR